GISMTADLATAEKTSFAIQTNATGELEARTQVEFRSRVESTTSIIQIVDEGEFVKAGDILCVLNSDEIQQEIEEDQLAVESARAEYVAAKSNYENQIATNESNLRKAELKLKLAQLALEEWKNGEDPKMKEQKSTAVEKAKRDLQRLEEKMEQSIELYKEEFLSKDEFVLEQIRLEEARAALVIAELDFDAYINYQRVMQEEQMNSDVREAAAEVELVKGRNVIDLAAAEASMNNRKQQLELRERRLERETDQLKNCEIRATTDGLVVYATSIERDRWGNSEGPLQVGQEIRRNELIMVLPDTSEMVASVRVHETLAGRIVPGQTASVRIDAVRGTELMGIVESVGIIAESGGWRDPNRREYTVRIALENEQGLGLKPAMRAEARITLGEVDDVLTIPLQAVFSDGPVRFVYVPDNGKFRRVPITIGRRSDTLAEVVDGIDDGQRVLIREPSPAEIIAEEWDPAIMQKAAASQRDARSAPGATRPGAPGAAGRPTQGGRDQGGTSTGTQQRPANDGRGEPRADAAEPPAEGATTESGETTTESK
ncbi:MAG: HlyD family efflux transporter periplasmic adaptor subunit, partial [Phycisphaerales bacterium]|nr:HlyD family efflux transporter periplasmic adaptor subunit [Phycisphaerales bacterium]